jgi:hypothetical protein
MGTVEKFLLLLFTAIIVGIVVTNPSGMTGFFQGLANFTSGTVGAFSRFGGGGGSNLTIPHVSMVG